MNTGKQLRILLTNDDGIHAPGLKALEDIARELSDDVWVVAPEAEQSGASHSLTLSQPLRIRKISERRFAVQGTPTDCSIVGVRHILPDRAPDLLLSGVNRGYNVADDVSYSGTVAGAMEGTSLGIRSVALSQAYGFEAHSRVRWETSTRHGARLIRKLLALDWPRGVLFNANFPDLDPDEVKGMKMTRQGMRDLNTLRVEKRMDPRHDPYYWLTYDSTVTSPANGTDLIAVEQGYISVSPLHMDMTREDVLRAGPELL